MVFSCHGLKPFDVAQVRRRAIARILCISVLATRALCKNKVRRIATCSLCGTTEVRSWSSLWLLSVPMSSAKESASCRASSNLASSAQAAGVSRPLRLWLALRRLPGWGQAGAWVDHCCVTCRPAFALPYLAATVAIFASAAITVSASREAACQRVWSSCGWISGSCIVAAWTNSLSVSQNIWTVKMLTMPMVSATAATFSKTSAFSLVTSRKTLRNRGVSSPSLWDIGGVMGSVVGFFLNHWVAACVFRCVLSFNPPKPWPSKPL